MSSAEYPGALWVPIPGFGFPTGAHGGNSPRWIVLHGTSSTGATAQNIANYFAGDNQNGTHFVIGKDGTVIQMVRLADAAYGNGGPTQAELQAHAYADFWQAEIDAGVNLNTVTVSIEHCKDSGNLEALTPAQQDASFKLVAWLCKTLSIPPRAADASGGITGHNSINGIQRAMCPGPYPWPDLFAYLTPKGGKGSMLLQHPTDAGRLDLVFLAADGNVWHSRNNSDGLAGLVKAAGTASMTLGAPAEKLLSAEATWSNTGSSLNVLAVGVSGQLYAKALDFGGVVEMEWSPISGELVNVPVPAPIPAPVPVPAQDPDVAKLVAWLKAAPTF